MKWFTQLKDYKKEMSIGIEMIEYFLPSGYITSEELAVNFGFDLSFVEEKIGVKRLYIAGDDEKGYFKDYFISRTFSYVSGFQYKS